MHSLIRQSLHAIQLFLLRRRNRFFIKEMNHVHPNILNSVFVMFCSSDISRGESEERSHQKEDDEAGERKNSKNNLKTNKDSRSFCNFYFLVVV